MLPPLPADWALGDTPPPDDLNVVKAYAGTGVQRLTTVLRRTTTQSIAHSAFVPVSWESVVAGRNGLGWTPAAPSRITIPAGEPGLYSVAFTGELALGAGGFRYCGLARNGTVVQPGLFCPGSGTLLAWLATSWDIDAVPGDYLEIFLFQNKDAVGALLLNVPGDSPRVTIRRVE